MNNDISLKTAFEYFLLDRESFCSDDTIKNYRNSVRYFLEYMEQARGVPADVIELRSITTNDLRNYVVYLRHKPLNFGHPFKFADDAARLSKRSIRNYSVDLKTFLSFLISEGFIDDILKGFRLIKAEKKVVIPLTASEVEEIDSLFSIKSSYGCRDLCIIHLMLDAGLRFNEVCELRVDHVLFDNRQIFVKYGKGDKERVVPMGTTLKKYLWSWMYMHRKYTEHDYFITMVDGSPLSDSSIKSLFARIRRKTGITRLKPHLLRHTFATSYIVGGGSVELLRILMGHSSIATTQGYLHVAAVYDMQGDIYELDSIFFQTYFRRYKK